MKRSLLVATLLLTCALGNAQPAAPEAKSVQEQVVHLVELLRDSYATGYPEATQVQTLKVGDRSLTLAVFTIEGFNGGNNYTQYLALFSADVSEAGAVYQRLVDVMPIGAGGWRAVQPLAAKVVSEPAQVPLLIDLPGMENTAGDAVNFPSRPNVIHLSLQGRPSERLLELH